MNINIGDKVRFLNDIGGGKVSGFQKNGIVLVEDEDGFEIPMQASEVVVVENTDNQNRPVRKAEPARPVIQEKPRKEKPVEPTEEDLRIAELREYYDNKRKDKEAEKVAKPQPTTAQQPANDNEETLEARIIRLEMTVRKLQMRLERLEDAKALREKIKANDLQKRNDSTRQHNEPMEVDLHAHELLETTAGMEAKDIKEYQLKTVRDTINSHIRNKGQRIVFIHGNGNGILRKAITDMLRHEYPSCQYQDASFQQYGFGATMVTIH